MPRGSRQTVRRTADRRTADFARRRAQPVKPCSFSEFLYIEIVLNYRSNANLLGLSPQENWLAPRAAWTMDTIPFPLLQLLVDRIL